MGRGPDKQLVTFWLPRADARRVLVAANRAGLSRSALIRWLLDGFVHETGHDDD